jgi:hypothetical protein
MIRVGNWAIDPADAATFVRVNAATSLYLPARILSPDQHDAIWAIQLPQQVGAHLCGADGDAREARGALSDLQPFANQQSPAKVIALRRTQDQLPNEVVRVEFLKRHPSEE